MLLATNLCKFFLQISAVLLPPSYLVDKGNSESFEGEGQQCLVCLVRRIPPNERIQGTPVEQFTTKLDTQGTIIALDASGVSPRYSQYINKVGLKSLCLGMVTILAKHNHSSL